MDDKSLGLKVVQKPAARKTTYWLRTSILSLLPSIPRPNGIVLDWFADPSSVRICLSILVASVWLSWFSIYSMQQMSEAFVIHPLCVQSTGLPTRLHLFLFLPPTSFGLCSSVWRMTRLSSLLVSPFDLSKTKKKGVCASLRYAMRLRSWKQDRISTSKLFYRHSSS